MPSRATLKSIAKDLGISHMTVSRALSGNPSVHKETRDKIVRRAQELGYVKNAAATAMRGDATKIVGLLLPNIVNEFYARFANAMADACEDQSLHLIIHLTNDDFVQECRALDRLREVQAMAVILVPTPRVSGQRAALPSDMKAVQLIRQQHDFENATSVLVDDHMAISAGVQHLAKSGHSAIGYIGGGVELSTGRSRLNAFRHGLSQAGLSERPELVFTETPSFEMGRRNAEKIIASETATGIVCGGVEISNGALSVLMDRGVIPSSEVGFVGYGDPSYYSWLGGGISTVGLPVDELAQKAVSIVGTDHPKDQIGSVSQLEARFIQRPIRKADSFS